MKLTVALVAAALAVSATAEAGSKREARALFKAGNDLLMAGDNVGALGKFQAAYEMFPSPKILLNIGTCLREMDRDAEAAEVFERYLADPKAEAGRTAEIRLILAAIDADMGRLRVPQVRPGTRLLLDGKPLDARPGSSIRIDPGSHVVVAEKAGEPPMVATVLISAGEERAVELVAATPAPPSTLVGAVDEPAAFPGEVEASVGHRAVPAWRTPSTHRGQPGVLARVDVDGKGRGAVLAVGATYGAGDFVDLSLGALLGSHRGFEPGASVYLARGAWKPVVYIGAPVFFVDGARAGIHAAAGLVWDPFSHAGFFLGAGIEYFPSTPEGYASTIFVPSAGVQGRL